MEGALPKIRVTDPQNGSAGSGLDSPSTTTDGGQSIRPRSATSSEGNWNHAQKRFSFLAFR